MAKRSSRRLRHAGVVGACLIVVAAALAGAAVARHATHRAAATSAHPLRLLQLNLCNSGIAPCYSHDRAVSEAEKLIRAERPDLVTLNEICRPDVSQLARTMASGGHGASIATGFEAARNARVPGAVHCTNGAEYGIGLVARVPSRRYRTFAGVYPRQNANAPEHRVWVCVHPRGRAYECTTHLSSEDQGTAFAQCRYLLHTVLPRLFARDGRDPVLLGADLNLPAGPGSIAQSCLPAGYSRVDDGGTQYAVVSPGVSVRSRTTIDMDGTTDHPGLLVDVTLP
jgi:hypothetical protein